MAHSKNFGRANKAQTEIVSTLLIIGVSIATVSVAYLWGVPLVQKGQSTGQLQASEAIMAQIAGAISDIIQNGGQKSISLELEGPLEVSDADNAVIYTILTKRAGVASNEWTPMNDDDTFGIAGTPQEQNVGVYGSDKDGVIIARASPADSGFFTEYRLVYRELDDTATKEGQLVVISAPGNNKVLSGKHTLTISREAPSISAIAQSRLEGRLTTTKVLLTLS